MNSVIPDEGQQEMVVDIVKYQLLAFRSLQSKEEIIPKSLPKHTFYFVHVGEQGLQFRSIPRSEINQLSMDSIENDRIYEQILKKSTVPETIDYEQILKLDTKSHKIGEGEHHLVGIYEGRSGKDKNKTSIILRFTTEYKMNQFYDEISRRVKEQKDFLKKSTINFVGVEENIRKIVQKIMLSSHPKRQIYNRICAILAKQNISLRSDQNKMMLTALMGNHPQMQNFLRKQRIEAYDIQKKRYDEQCSSVVVLAQPCRQIIQGYSEKRKLDGVVPKRGQKQQKQQNYMKDQQFMYISRIPERTQRQIDEMIGIESENIQQMQNEPKDKQILNYRTDKIKIPVKQYSIMSKQVQRVQKQPIPLPQVLDKNQLVTIQAVKFMYQLMKINTKFMNAGNKGPLDSVLEHLKVILTECQRRSDDKKPIQSKSVSELLNKANRNWLEYRKDPHKFY